jgi:large-conductance mechanosensitive channel
VKAEYNNTLDTNINENGTEIPTEIVDKLDSKSSSSPEALLSITNFLLLTNFVLLSIIIFLLIKFSQDKQAKRLMSKQDKIESEADSVTNVLSSIKQAARKNNLMDMRELILRWGSITFPYLNPLTLHRLAISMDDQELATKFESLDNYLFGNTKTKELVLDLNIIADKLSIYTKSVTKKNEKKSKTNPLRNLYPN